MRSCMVLLYEFKADLNAYLRVRRGRCDSAFAADVIRSTSATKRRDAVLRAGAFLKAEAKGRLASAEYTEALATCRRLARTEGIDAVMDANKLDAIVAPTDGPAWLTDLMLGDHPLGSSSTPRRWRDTRRHRPGRVRGGASGRDFFCSGPLERAGADRLAYAFEQAHTRAQGAALRGDSRHQVGRGSAQLP